MASILVVDADSASRKLMFEQLQQLGHDVIESETAGSALRAAHQARPDLMVCDFSLPDLAGPELLRDLRSSEQLRRIRVLMTSAEPGPEAMVAALESGADDFVGKPILVPEFLARVDVCLSRPARPGESDFVEAGGIRIDDVGRRVAAGGDYVSLAPTEYRLLLFLLVNQDRVFSREQLLVHVWDRAATVGPRTVDVHVRRLRSILEPYGYDRYLQTVRGSGYRFSLEA